jgi:hypothetical protein
MPDPVYSRRMENALPFESHPAHLIEPFTLVALARQDLTAGEMIHFDVDSSGKITSPNFLFVPTTPRLAKITTLRGNDSGVE